MKSDAGLRRSNVLMCVTSAIDCHNRTSLTVSPPSSVQRIAITKSGSGAGLCHAAPRNVQFTMDGWEFPRIELLGVTSAAGYARQVQALRQGFHDLGYDEGQNLVIEYRWADGRSLLLRADRVIE
jgi:hypothetical protein